MTKTARMICDNKGGCRRNSVKGRKICNALLDNLDLSLARDGKMIWKSHEIIVTPILFLLKMVFCKHPIIASSFLFFLPYFPLFLFFLLLVDQLSSSLSIHFFRVSMWETGGEEVVRIRGTD